ncbi:MAG: hypothetical protein DRN05_04815 [Thermoplasmata archaeon]|nr:MAG: hypothetical protein DRN05_04815 [Thermoplasmata archaeon]
MKRAIEIIKASVIETYGDKEADIFAVGLVQKLEEEGLINQLKYKDGFYILMEYWDSLPDEMKPEIDRKLKKLGL